MVELSESDDDCRDEWADTGRLGDGMVSTLFIEALRVNDAGGRTGDKGTPPSALESRPLELRPLKDGGGSACTVGL